MKLEVFVQGAIISTIEIGTCPFKVRKVNSPLADRSLQDAHVGVPPSICASTILVSRKKT
jgi:hypothetical protein